LKAVVHLVRENCHSYLSLLEALFIYLIAFVRRQLDCVPHK